jgi:hypothetical protein
MAAGDAAEAILNLLLDLPASGVTDGRQPLRKGARGLLPNGKLS